MESVKHVSAAHSSLEKTSTVTAGGFAHRLNKHADSFENARFGWMAILITIQSCLGAAACMFILKNNASVFELVTCACIAMGSNALFIALAKPKICLAGFYISVFLNTIFLLQNI